MYSRIWTSSDYAFTFVTAASESRKELSAASSSHSKIIVEGTERESGKRIMLISMSVGAAQAIEVPRKVDNKPKSHSGRVTAMVTPREYHVLGRIGKSVALGLDSENTQRALLLERVD